MFIDQVKIFARAGPGGRGCVAFRREAFVPKGGPSGGDGGRGGHVILEASHDINNLIAQFYQPRLVAKQGEHGQGKDKHGRAGKDVIVQVPGPRPIPAGAVSTPRTWLSRSTLCVDRLVLNWTS